jgi:hypothetical protein
MTELLRENASYRKAKTPIIAKYQDDHTQLMSAIAGRGFTKMPGYAYDAENKIELAAKMGLSELNHKILSETIERELKQMGIDYDLSYKNAAIIWEIEKQSLMSLWDAELQGIKQGMAEEEEVLDQMAIEIAKRAIVLMEAKTTIEENMEAYRKTLVELDGSTAPYEVQLANAKLLTAQKKLELIPILTEILAKERELLIAESLKAGYYTTYIEAERAVSNKKGTLTPVINDLANKVETYATKITTEQIPKEEQIADEKIAQMTAAVRKSGYQLDELTADIATDTKRLDLADDKRDLATTVFDYDQGIVSHENELNSDYQEAVKADHLGGLADERANMSQIIAKKSSIDQINKTTKLDSVNTLTTAEINASGNVASAEIAALTAEATLNAKAAITAKLTQLIG